MDNQVASAEQETNVTELSICVKNRSAVFRNKRTIATPEDGASGSRLTQRRNESNVSVPEQSASQSTDDVAETANLLEPDQDDFSTAEQGFWRNLRNKYNGYYEKAWPIVNNDYAIPFWLLLLGLPLSAGIMGSLHMNTCPIYPDLSHALYINGFSLMAVITFRVCLILSKAYVNSSDETHTCLRTLVRSTTFMAVLFYVLEAIAYWQKDTTLPDLCDPGFQIFLFWWNCIMIVVIIPIVLFPS